MLLNDPRCVLFHIPSPVTIENCCRQLCENQCLDVCILPNELCLLINIKLYTYKTLKSRLLFIFKDNPYISYLIL